MFVFGKSIVRNILQSLMQCIIILRCEFVTIQTEYVIEQIINYVQNECLSKNCRRKNLIWTWENIHWNRISRKRKNFFTQWQNIFEKLNLFFTFQLLNFITKNFKRCGFDSCLSKLNEEITIILIDNLNDFHWH